MTDKKWDLKGRGAIYLRVSKGVQQKDTDEESRQWSDIQGWLTEYGVTVAPGDVFRDVGSRSDAPDRTNFQRLLADAGRGVYRWIVVDRQDRFGTYDEDEWGHYRYLLRKAKCDLYMAVGDECLTSGDLGTFIKSALGAHSSKRELEDKSARGLGQLIVNTRAGKWPGGHIPYGMDVVCFDANGEPRWRLEHCGREGKNPIRVKTMPDGSSQTFKGEYNAPAREHGESLRLRPSLDVRKVEAVRKVFQWYAVEDVPYAEIARRLNRLGLKPTYGDNWRSHDVWRLVRNKIYIGIQTYGKASRGDHFEVTGGRVVPRQTRDYSTRDECEWIESDPMFDPVVPVELFEKVGGKLKADPPKRRAPKSEQLWLSGLLRCSVCGNNMRGVTHGGRKAHKPEYICSAYSEATKLKTPCQCNRNGVSHDTVVGYVRKFLTDSGHDLRMVLAAQAAADPALLAPLREKQTAGMRKLFQAHTKMVEAAGYKTARSQRIKMDGWKDDSLKGWNPESFDADLERFYRRLFTRREKGIRDEIARLDGEHTTKTKAYAGLVSERAKAKVNAELAELDARLAELENRLGNAADEAADVRAELARVSEELDTAESSLEGDDDRRTAEAVRQVVERVDLTFAPTGRKCPTSKLVEVVVVPKGADPRRYPHSPDRYPDVPSPPGRNCTSSGRSGSCCRTSNSAAARWTTGPG